MEPPGFIYMPEEMLEQPLELVKINGVQERDINLQQFMKYKGAALVSKRIFDIFFSTLVILLILTWMIPIIALLIKIDSRGPIFFLQKRVGMRGVSFTCFKFRTMLVTTNAEKDMFAPNHSNITAIGKFLRQSNLDELPQFFNVLLGTMSVVGPRPHIYTDCRRFSYLIDNYKNRNWVKPGITGLAQVKGYHGPVSDPVSIFRRYYWDMIYIKRLTLPLDIKIVCKTAWQRMSWLFFYLCNHLNSHFHT